MNIKIEQLKKRQSEIEAFFEKTKTKAVTGPVLRKWIVDSVIHFTEIGVSVNLIDLFIERCEFQEDKRGTKSHGIFKPSFLNGGYILRDKGKTRDVSPFIIPIQVALGVSRMLVEKYEEEERIIPKSLIAEFDTEKHQPIKLALEGIETNYKTRDSRGIMGPLVTATELICKFIPELNNEKNISVCLRKLYGEKGLYEKYRINREVLWALNNARIVRNEEIIHAKPEYEGNVPMHEAVGYAHLLVLFIDSIFASNKDIFV